MRIATQIRTLATFRAPYMASTMFALALVPAKGIGTFAIDEHGRIYVDEDLVGSRWTLEQAAWVLVHEVWHWALKHAERSKVLTAHLPDAERAEEAQQVNIAADLEINGGMREAKADLPDDGVFPQDYKFPIHLPFEQYYELLKKQNKQPKSSSGNDGSGKGKGKGSWDCGSGAHGQSRPWEQGSRPGNGGSEEKPNGNSADGQARALTESEQELLRDALATNLKEASKTRGTVPAFAERWADKRLAPPKVSWERELRAHISNSIVMLSGAADYTWQRPSRRGNPTGVIMPRLVKPSPEVVCVVDTSGSMSEGMVASALAEVNGVVKAIGQREVPVVCCDAYAHNAQKVNNAASVKVKGGGGTDMRIGIEKAIEQCPNAKVVVVLTDGYTPWPDSMPAGYQLVVALIGNNDVGSVPSYARAIVVE